ncbi:hypothetical protein EYR41_010797 [Orbilia oligospora]|uniref:Uncharacterized protein n=1 Tax=Orbilia oligospora TaxID=2813651 RepID=A0A7C8KDY0_ORBOL|nr:hypothetical protein TWF751_006729 [Orbilia oligospora]TGJ64761.1 hypothetical protein EYR41_010797 [Orbilia oligospora]
MATAKDFYNLQGFPFDMFETLYQGSSYSHVESRWLLEAPIEIPGYQIGFDIFKSGKDKWATPKLWDPIDYYGTDDEDSDDLTLEDGTVTNIRSEGTAITFEGRRVKLRRPQKPFNHRKVLGAISKGFFDNVTRIDIEYHAKDIKPFREFVNPAFKIPTDSPSDPQHSFI